MNILLIFLNINYYGITHLNYTGFFRFTKNKKGEKLIKKIKLMNLNLYFSIEISLKIKF
jgi:hypothetical protein